MGTVWGVASKSKAANACAAVFIAGFALAAGVATVSADTGIADREADPVGVERPGRTEVIVKDPLDETVERFVYLFEKSDGFVPAVLPDDVSYDRVFSPARAIRSYIGANSGTFTQRDQIYYPGRMDNNTYLRVHAGIADFIMAMDHSEAAFGMTYTSCYRDDMSPRANNNAILCSGDTHAIGASGPRTEMANGGSNTDPTRPPTSPSTKVNWFTGSRVTFYSAPGETIAAAKLRSQQVDEPLGVGTGEMVNGPTGGSTGPTGRTAPPTGQAAPPTGPSGPTGPTPTPNPAKPGRKNWVGLKVNVKPARIAVRTGRSKKVKVTVRNIGDQLGKRIKICPVAKNSLVKTTHCKVVKKLRPKRRVKRTFRVRPRSAAADENRFVVRFRAKASKSKSRSAKLYIRPR